MCNRGCTEYERQCMMETCVCISNSINLAINFTFISCNNFTYYYIISQDLNSVVSRRITSDFHIDKQMDLFRM